MGNEPTADEELRADDFLIGVATKCTFCADTVDAGVARGLTPGKDPEATPACVNLCISGALAFGDIDDPQSPGVRASPQQQALQNARGAGNQPRLLLSMGSRAVMTTSRRGSGAPWLQRSWDNPRGMQLHRRRLGNRRDPGGNSGAIRGLVPYFPAGILAVALIGFGLLMGWSEFGRPLRALNVFFHPQTSWMSREALLALPLLAFAGVAVILGQNWVTLPSQIRLAAGPFEITSAVLALSFLFS